MADAFASEWIKLRRRSLFYGSYAAMLAVSCLVTVLTFSTAGRTAADGPAGASTPLSQLAQSGGSVNGLEGSLTILGVIAFAIAASQMAMEYGQGTLRNLLVRQPRRFVFLVGKFLAVSTFMMGAVAIATVGTVVVAFAMAHSRGIPTDQWTMLSGLRAIGTGFVDVTLSIVGYGLLGMTLGIVMRSSVAAVAVGIAYLLPVEQILASTVTSTAGYLPGQLLSAVAQGGTSTIGYAHSLVGALLYLALAAGVGIALFVHRDVVS
ncbi:MAG: ABC transporter permease [Acidimicrobiales bacterium]|jgi:ABC-type transport system involved in multi-copper enzyme maturation permease subunit